MQVFCNGQNDIVSFTVNDDNARETHWTEGLAIIYVLRGTAKIVRGSDCCVLFEENFVVVNPFELYRVLSDANTDVLCMQISQKALSRLPANTHCLFECCSARCEAQKEYYIEQLRGMIASLFRITYKQTPVSAAHVYRDVFELLDLLLQHFARDEADEEGRHTRPTEQFCAVLRYINENYRENISVGGVAREHFLTANTLSRYFKKYLNMTFTDYLLDIRLDGAYADLLSGRSRITDIALDNGFGSTSSFIRGFHRKYGMTPGKCRDVISQGQENQKQDDKNSGIGFQTLLRHCRQDSQSENSYELRDVAVSVPAGDGARTSQKWRNLLCVGYAKELLMASVQKQLKRIQSDIGFAYLGFHGIFDDDMLVYSENENGAPNYDFTLVDQCLDFLMEIEIRPYLELSFTPSALVGNCYRSLRKGSYLCVPCDINKWLSLVHEFVCHVEKRYGVKEVEKWYFSTMSIHCAIGSGEHADEDLQAYFELYRRQYALIKSLNADYRVVGPGLYSNAVGERYFAKFIQMCEHEKCVPDQYTSLCFPYNLISDRDFFCNLARDGAFPESLSDDEQYVLHFRERFGELCAELGAEERELTLVEWNATMWQRDYSNDCCFKAAYLAKNIAENWDSFWGMGYWTANDMMEETVTGGRPFHGGYGLHTAQGIAKSGYHAMYLLAKLKRGLVCRGDGYMVTRENGETVILLYNYCHYDMLFRNHYIEDERAAACYDHFVDKEDIRFSLTLESMPQGRYRVRTWSVSREHGSSFDMWIAMGEPEQLGPEERRMLEGVSGPMYRVETAAADESGALHISAQLAAHEIQIISIDSDR